MEIHDKELLPERLGGNQDRSHSAMLGILALLVGIVALALAVLPIAIEPPKPGAPQQPDGEVVEAKPQGRFNFRWKNFSVSLGKDKEPVDEEALRERKQREQAARAVREGDEIARRKHESLLRWLTFASAGFALVGLTLGPISWARERQPALAGFAMAISGAALLWQYIVIGVVVGIVVLIVLAFIGSIAS